ncbi:hypothetical protein CALCODRAFT_488893 [Calocera cornea HHB12733]|uniref:Uncharacterized protein n=1 Tax=Calocera cornea HHB12733 TaxID=1353952 RepID=A0A165C3K9_9BASI|nr:hypothetical protein CALCODRAFT_488893 [Calocera cornea HHB12733]
MLSKETITYTFQQAYPGGIIRDITNASYTPMVIVGSDASGFGTRGTRETFDVLDPSQPLPANCHIYPQNFTTGLEDVTHIYIKISECNTMNVNVSRYNTTNAGLINVDTIVPSGDSYRTVINASETDGKLTWPLTAKAGMNVKYDLSSRYGYDDFGLPLQF